MMSSAVACGIPVSPVAVEVAPPEPVAGEEGTVGLGPVVGEETVAGGTLGSPGGGVIP